MILIPCWDTPGILKKSTFELKARLSPGFWFKQQVKFDSRCGNDDAAAGNHGYPNGIPSGNFIVIPWIIVQLRACILSCRICAWSIHLWQYIHIGKCRRQYQKLLLVLVVVYFTPFLPTLLLFNYIILKCVRKDKFYILTTSFFNIKTVSIVVFLNFGA